MGGRRYRGDIEGLRAIAVLAVLLFHVGVAPLRGGFLGVDVFFVISGFLITGGIAREIDRGGFSLAAFYRRRVARIVPALLLMEVGVLAAALFLAFPGELEALRGAAVAAALFLSNLYFWRRDPYFAPPSDVQPLLHTWSLGVEEQFYLLYPLLLMAAGRGAAARRLALVALLTLASLAAAYLLRGRDPQAAFYLLPTRLWELGLGALVTLARPPPPRRRLPRELLAAAAIAALALSFVLIGVGSGPQLPPALLPCLATAWLLAAGERSLAGRTLALPPLRAIGRLSYSLYLWHWPVLAFWRLTVGVALTPMVQAGLIAASFLLASLSYFAVEKPLRRRLRGGRTLPVLAGGGLACAAVAGIAVAVTTGALQLHRLPPQVLRTLAAQSERPRPPLDPLDPACIPGKSKVTECLRPVPGRRNVLLIGDSHAAHIWPALFARFPGTHFLVSFQWNCRPVGRAAPRREGCRTHALDAAAVARGLPIDGVLIAGRWEREELPALRQAILALRAAGRPVTVVGPVVEYLPSAPQLLARAQLVHDRRLYDYGRTLSREALDRDMQPLVERAGARYFSAYRAECPAGAACRLLTASGHPFHFDYGHYTADGAREIVAAMPPP